MRPPCHFETRSASDPGGRSIERRPVSSGHDRRQTLVVGLQLHPVAVAGADGTGG
jgi:hypothetical protein